jgi:hypothetical protein
MLKVCLCILIKFLLSISKPDIPYHLSRWKNGFFPHLIGLRLILILSFETLSQHRQLFAVILKAKLFMSSQISSHCSPNMGEALAAQLVILLVRSLLLNQFILESDSVVVIQALNHSNSNFNWRISPIILESLDTIPSASSCKVRKINRSANFCVHSVAHWAAARSHFGSILFCSSSFLSSSLASGNDHFLSLSLL